MEVHLTIIYDSEAAKDPARMLSVANWSLGLFTYPDRIEILGLTYSEGE